jgi:hypothetical protein
MVVASFWGLLCIVNVCRSSERFVDVRGDSVYAGSAAAALMQLPPAAMTLQSSSLNADSPSGAPPTKNLQTQIVNSEAGRVSF